MSIEWIQKDFEKSGLNGISEEMKIVPVPVGNAGESLLMQTIGFSTVQKQAILQASRAYIIGYPDGYSRVKLEKSINGCKYLSPAKQVSGSGFHFYYIPAEEEKLKSQKDFVIFTEGEKKTAKLTQELRKLNQGTAVGFPGVTMWRDCPWEGDFKGFKWESIRMKDRIVFICFDSDSIEKPDVRNQIVSLYLFCRKKKSKVKIITWQKEEGKGIDDYLVQKEKDGAKPEIALKSLIDSAIENPLELPGVQSTASLSMLFAKNLLTRAESKILFQEMKAEEKLNVDFAAFWELVTQEKQNIKKSKSPKLAIVEELRENQNKVYIINKDGIWVQRTNGHSTETYQICPQVVKVTRIMRDVITGNVSAIIEFDGREERVPLEVISFTKNIEALAAKGCRITSLTAKDMVGYFALCLNKIEKTEKMASQNGWINDSAFVLGDNIITSKGEEKIIFDGQSYIPGKTGKNDTWIKYIAHFEKDAQVAMRIGMSIISPALKKLGCSSFINHLWGASTSGKTISSFVAASIWGKPSVIVEAWQQSRTGKETYFEEAGSLPVFLDEAHREDPKEIEKTVYDFCNEKGKGRGRVAGTKGGEVKRAKSKTWFGIMLSTGEGKISEHSQKAGVEARILEQQRPTPKKDQKEAKILSEIRNGLDFNNGYLGPEIIKFFLTRMDEVKQQYAHYADILNEHIQNNLQARQVPYLAATLAGCHVAREMAIPIPAEETILKLAIDYLGQDVPKSTDEKALEFIADLVAINTKKFEQANKADCVVKSPEANEVWGKYNQYKGTVDFIPSILKSKLKENGFDESVLYLLREKGKLKHVQGKLTRKSRINDVVQLVITVCVEVQNEENQVL